MILQRTALLLCLLFSSAHAAVSSYLIFGDSISDETNVYALMNHTYPAPPNYAGRFSNGPVWPEYLQGIRLNYAHGGATSEYLNVLAKYYPELTGTGLSAQIDEYFRDFPDAQGLADSRVYIHIGGNDFYAMIDQASMSQESTIMNSAIQEIVDNIVKAVERLKAAGAKDIVVMNLPNLALIPMVQDYPLVQRQLMTSSTNYFNSQLKTAAKQYRFAYYDLNQRVQQVVDKPAKYGLKNVKHACFNPETQTICNNPDEYFFWDNVHPSAKMHQLIETFLRSDLLPPG